MHEGAFLAAVHACIKGSAAMLSVPHCWHLPGLRFMTDEEVDALVAEIESEKSAADAARRRPAAGDATAGA